MIRVFVGFDPRETFAFHVLCQSIHARASEPVTVAPSGGSTFMLAAANAIVPIWSIDIAHRDDAFLVGRDRRA